MLEDDLKAVVKPQYVDQIPKAVKGADRTVETLLTARSQMDNLEKILDVLGMLRHPVTRMLVTNVYIELRQVLDRDIGLLSGGELQRFAIGIVCVQQADVYVSSPQIVSLLFDDSIVICSMSRPHTWTSSSVSMPPGLFVICSDLMTMSLWLNTTCQSWTISLISFAYSMASLLSMVS